LQHFIYRRRNLAIYVLLGSLLIHGLWGLAQFVLQSDLNLDFLGEAAIELGRPGIATFTSLTGEKLIRAYGPYPHPNILAGSIAVGLIIALRQYHGRRDLSRLLPLTFTYFLGLALVATFSRTAWLAGSLLYLVSRLTKTEVVRLTLVLTTLITCAPLLLARIPSGDEAALVERRNGLADARAMIQQSPFWHGVGPGNYKLALAEQLDRQQITYESWEVVPVHNVPLLLVAELGLLPSLLSLSVIIFLWGPRFRTTWLFALPLIPLLLLDHYLLTQAAPLLYLVMALLLLAAPLPALIPAPRGIISQKDATADRPTIGR
jgi:hypothetical protein